MGTAVTSRGAASPIPLDGTDEVMLRLQHNNTPPNCCKQLTTVNKISKCTRSLQSVAVTQEALSP
jgi:hypothetical protein